jgi:hypothetical protein
MILLDAFRPDSWNFPLLLHVGGAAVFFGAVMLSAVTQLTAVRAPEPDVLRRVAFRTLLIVGLPAYIVFRLAAEWLISKEPDDFDPAWIGIGFIVSDIGGLLFLISLILAGIATRKRTGWVTKTCGVLSAIIVVELVIGVCAMGAKPC